MSNLYGLFNAEMLSCKYLIIIEEEREIEKRERERERERNCWFSLFLMAYKLPKGYLISIFNQFENVWL